MHSNRIDFDEVARIRHAIVVAIHDTGKCRPFDLLVALHGVMGAIVMRMPIETQADVAKYWANTWDRFIAKMHAPKSGDSKH